tara:strand:- start:216 stop:470 length:255 start_codon:yes stop_codon:yes gene_type:complete
VAHAADPASTVGDVLFVITTSSVDEHVPFVMVHLNVAFEPVETLVTADVFDDDEEIVAEPETTLQAPVPDPGEFAAIVKLPLLH